MEDNDKKPLDDNAAESASADAQDADKETVSEEDSLSEVPKTSTEANELAAMKDKYLRLFSDFENYKRRNAKERLELIQTASKDLLLAILPILDDFDRAQKSMTTASEQNIEQLKEGMGLIHNKLFKLLESKGLKKMPSAKDQTFDMDLHEAITQFPAPDDSLKGKVVEEVECGYMIGDKVVRFAKVVVGV